MPLYLVKVRLDLEWECAYDSPDANVAEEEAYLEAQRYGTVVDRQAIVEEVQPVEVAD